MTFSADRICYYSAVSTQRRTLTVMLATLTPGAAALVYSLVHALRFTACLDEIPLEILGAWAAFSVVGTIPAGLLGAVWLARRRTVGSVEVVTCPASLGGLLRKSSETDLPPEAGRFLTSGNFT